MYRYRYSKYTVFTYQISLAPNNLEFGFVIWLLSVTTKRVPYKQQQQQQRLCTLQLQRSTNDCDSHINHNNNDNNSTRMIIDPIEDQLGISTYLTLQHRNKQYIVGGGGGTSRSSNIIIRTTVTDTSNVNGNDGTSTTTTTSNCGTTTYDGFTAISKARFSDFIVHEGTSSYVASWTARMAFYYYHMYMNSRSHVSHIYIYLSFKLIFGQGKLVWMVMSPI